MLKKVRPLGLRVKNYYDDKYKHLQDVYQQCENLRFYGIEEETRGNEETHSILEEFFVQVMEIQPREVQQIEFQQVHYFLYNVMFTILL